MIFPVNCIKREDSLYAGSRLVLPNAVGTELVTHRVTEDELVGATTVCGDFWV